MTTPKKIDRYEVVRRLGAGGMGEVYEAVDRNINRRVAIKILKEEFDTEDFRDRFLREAQAAAQLDEHPNIVKIIGAWKFKGRPFIAMEYIAGSSLAQIIARAERLAVPRKLEILEELCAGLAWAHAGGVVHRDIKPGNVMIDGRGHVKIVDFGIAKSDSWDGTSQQIAMGTPCYMSPEQLRRLPVDSRTDMFSTGVVAFELLTYRKLFEGDAMQQVARVLSGHIPAMTVGKDVIPSAIERIVRRALASDPAHRFSDMMEMHDALRTVRELPLTAAPNERRWWERKTLPFNGELIDPRPMPALGPRSMPVVFGISAAVALTVGGWLIFDRPTLDKSDARPTAAAEASAPAGPEIGSSKPSEPTQPAKGGPSRPASPPVVAAGNTPSPQGTLPTLAAQDQPTLPAAHQTDPQIESAAADAPPPPDPSIPIDRGSPDRPGPPIDEAAVLLALKGYEEAYASLSAAAVKTIRPSLSPGEVAALDSEFLEDQSYLLKITNWQIKRVDDGKARVTCTITKSITRKHGDPRTFKALASITLQQSDGRWIIESIR